MGKFYNLKKTKGITLIALVITIIVLLILAGVTISALLGENGVLNKAIKANEKTKIAEEREQISIAYADCKIDLLNLNEKFVTSENLEKKLIENGNNVTTLSNDNEEEYLIYVTFEDTQHVFLVDQDGKIEFLESDEKVDTSSIDKKLVKQEDISYIDGTEELKNPDRGWMKPVSIVLTGDTFAPKYNNINSYCEDANKNKIGVLHLRIDIGSLSGSINEDGNDKNLTANQISSLNNLMSDIRDNNLSAIVRFSYGSNTEIQQEPKSFDTIKNHIKQLSTFFNTNKDIISAVEAGFLGPWGEMHDAGMYQEDSYYKELIQTLLANTPSTMTINVRKPHFYKLVVGELNNTQHRIGIFNDGYLGSHSDLGTFDHEITREEFVNWMEVQGNYTLYGGEASKVSTDSPEYSAEDEEYSNSSFALEEMPRTHTSYLNNEFNTEILDKKWKNETYIDADSEYNGQTAYKYIGDHLGYRMVLRSSEISSSVQKGEVCGVNLKIENVGFAKIIRNQKCTVLLRKDNVYYETALNVNINNINNGETDDVNFYFYIPSDIVDGEWKIYLKVANAYNKDYAIQFANPDIWDSDLQANYLGKVTIENTVANQNVKIKQAFVTGAPEGNMKTIETKVPTISVIFRYYDVAKSEEEEDRKIAETTLKIPLGATIDFKDANNLSTLGIVIPNDYEYKYAVSNDLKNDWNAYDDFQIPSEYPSDKEYYYVEIYVQKKNTIRVVFRYYDDLTNAEVESAKQEMYLSLGTYINFKDADNLRNLGIVIPAGYEFKGMACEAILGNWNRVDSITIPNEVPADIQHYNIQVHLQQGNLVKVQLSFFGSGDVGIIKGQNIYVAPGTIFNFADADSLKSLGVEIPDGYVCKEAQCFAIFGDWNYHSSVTIPTENLAEEYTINIKPLE